MKWFAYILIIFTIVGCQPEAIREINKKKRDAKKVERFQKKRKRQMDRFIKRNPGLLFTDSVEVETEITVDEIDTTTVIETNKDVSGIDSVLFHYDTIRTVLTDTQYVQLVERLKRYVTERKVITDTVKIQVDSVTTVIIYSDGKGDLVHRIYRPEQKIKKKTKTAVEVIKPPEISTWERLISWLHEMWRWVLGIGITVGIIGVILKYAWGALTTMFPWLLIFTRRKDGKKE